MSEKRNAGHTDAADGNAVLRIQFSWVVTALVVGVLAFGCAFLLGVMVGRGYNPEHQLPQLARWLPAKEEGPAAPQEKVGDTPQEKVIEPEELHFAGALKNGGTLPALAGNAPRSNSTAPVSSTPGAPEKAPPPPSAPLFAYTFQLASYKGMDAARGLLAKLAESGYRANVEKSGKLYKVLLTIRGPEEKAEEVRRAMGQLGLTDILQRAKTPLTPASSKRR